MASEPAIVAIFAAFTEEYGIGLFKATDEKIALYERLLADIPDDVLNAAAAHCITLYRFPPRISQLRDAAVTLMGGGAQELSAGEAWGLVCKALYAGALVPDTPEALDLLQERVGPYVWRAFKLEHVETFHPGTGRVDHFVRATFDLAVFCEQMPRLAKCVDAVGGWRALRMSDNTVADRSQFVRVYDAIAAREREDRLMLPEVRELAKRLAGRVEAEALPEGK